MAKKVINNMTKNARKLNKQARKKYAARVANVTRARADRVLAQGTGRVAAHPFGSMSIPRSLGLHPKCWDAFCTAHAPLPRSVGPYTVVRTSFLTATSAKCGLIGTFKRRQTVLGAVGSSISPEGWSNCVMVTEEATTAIGSTPSSGFHYSPFPGGGTNVNRTQTTFTCCPAAISVQIIGPTAINDANGQLCAAVVPARMDLTDDTRTWQEIQTDITSYFRPRLLSAGKLTLRGVQMDSHPLSMADVSTFEPLIHNPPNPNSPEVVNWDINAPYPCGWAPMAFVNPSGADIQLLIGVEWRVRFDVGNPAVASHQHHGVSSDVGWDQQIRRATEALPGVIDIVEKVANTGLGLYRGAAAAGLI